MRLIRVFPRRNKATPNDDLARFGPPGLFDEADEVHVSVTFTADKAIAERLAEQWQTLPIFNWQLPAKDQRHARRRSYVFRAAGSFRRGRRGAYLGHFLLGQIAR